MVKCRSVKRSPKNVRGLGRDRAAEPVRIFLTACSCISATDIPSHQAFSQDFESGSPNFMWAKGPHSICGTVLLRGSGGMLPQKILKN